MYGLHAVTTADSVVSASALAYTYRLHTFEKSLLGT